MRILVVGFLAFSIWSAIATYIYVCQIKGLCYEPISLQISETNNKDIIASDTTARHIVLEQAVIPKNLVIHFAFDKSEFNSETETERYFNESNSFLNKNTQARLSITGHTDAIGSDMYNQALGFRRAQTMQHYFESKGMPGNKIVIESRGEKEPADDNHTKSGRANNRRAVITIIK
jgi:outer membrane protein OmpA-like peptidoglycan-associated protein